MPVTTKQKSSRGIPRKARNPARKQKHKRYWDRSTCNRCSLLADAPVVFSSPKSFARHALSNHHDLRGLRKEHHGVQELAMKAIEAKLKGHLFS